MMRKNRKKRQGGFMFPAPLAAVLVIVAALSLLYVCLNAKTEALGRELKALEGRRDALRAKLIREQWVWAQMQAPSSIERALRDHGLVMMWPAVEQIVRVRVDGVVEGLASRERPSSGRVDRYNGIVMND
jgi:hypothetical protein